jgi:hypothetical protein
MRSALASVLVLHGLIHALGFAQAFHLADMPGFHHPIAGRAGLLWLAAALLLVGSGGLLLGSARAWWRLALPGVALSQLLIVSAWNDAKYGTLANVLVLVPLLTVSLDLHRGPRGSAPAAIWWSSARRRDR